MASEIKMARRDAAGLIDRVRSLLAQKTPPENIEKVLEREFQVKPLQPCRGEAHNPEVGGMIDHCGCCAPRWGWEGARIKVT